MNPGQLHLCEAPDKKAQAHGRRCGEVPGRGARSSPGYTEATRLTICTLQAAAHGGFLSIQKVP